MVRFMLTDGECLSVEAFVSRSFSKGLGYVSRALSFVLPFLCSSLVSLRNYVSAD